jgi:hypothetical protein
MLTTSMAAIASMTFADPKNSLAAIFPDAQKRLVGCSQTTAFTAGPSNPKTDRYYLSPKAFEIANTSLQTHSNSLHSSTALI